MERMKKIGMGILALIIVIFLTIFLLRIYNDSVYQDIDVPSIPEYYEDVTDIDLYPTDHKDVDIAYIDYGRLQGFHFIPQEKSHKGVVLCFGGSEGSPNFETAERLSQEGFETFALFMFGRKNQQKTLTRIPLEQFEDILDFINKNVEDKGPISIVGASKGAEYALNIAGKYSEVSNLVLIAPSSYNFAGLDFDHYGSSWTYRGEELPYIDMKRGSLPSFLKDLVFPSIVKGPISYKEIYKSAVEMDGNRQEKAIPVKGVEANILMIVGEEDMLWDSMGMANQIQEQNPNAKIISYRGAGHIFSNDGVLNLDNMRIRTGGDLESNQKAQKDSQKAIDRFLQEQHK